MKARIPSTSERMKRALNKAISINRFVNKNNDDIDIIPEGTKVKLNYQNITNHPDYARKVNAYKDFIETNKNKVFTVEYDKIGKHSPILVCLKEDKSKVKWLFHSEYDLIII